MKRITYLPALCACFFFCGIGLSRADDEAVRLIEGIGETNASYHLFVPERSENVGGYPVVYAFHPSGNGKAMLDRLRPAAEKYGWAVVGCNYLRNRMGGKYPAGFEAKMAREIMDDVESRLSIDPSRRYLAGLSGGASRAYEIASSFDREFAGILAFAGWLGVYDDGRTYPTGLAVAIINGRSDRGAERYRRIDTEILERDGAVVRSFFFDGGHSMPSAPEFIVEAAGWLEEVAKRKRVDEGAEISVGADNRGQR